MLRSAASRVFSAVQGAVRMNLYRSASSMQVQPVFDPSGGEAGQKITYLGTTPETADPNKENIIIDVHKGQVPPPVPFDNSGRLAWPPVGADVKGPDPKFDSEALDYEHPGYEGEGYVGKSYPADAFSDGKERVIFPSKDLVPPLLWPNRGVCVPPPFESEEEMDQRFVDFFNREDIDGWQLRSQLQSVLHKDNIPEPRITIAAFYAMRRINEHSMAVRWLEALHYKCRFDKRIWPWMMQELEPTMKELGISSPEELGYDKPELWMPDVMDM